MIKQIRRIRLTIIGAICLVALASYLLIALPLKQELQKSIQQNFIYSAEGAAYSVENFLDHCLNAAESLSSKTMIKQAMVDYQNGRMTLDELKEYTAPQYENVYRVQEKLTGAVRLMDGLVIAEQGVVAWEKIENPSAIKELTLQVDPATLMVTIYSPIKEEDDEIIGHDIVFVNISNLMYGVHEGHMQHEIYTATQVKDKFNGAKFIAEGLLTDNGAATYYIKPLKYTDLYFVASTPNRLLFRPIQSTLAKIAFAFPLLNFFIILIINYLAFSSIGKLAKELEEKKNWYQKIASTDYLTNTSTRHHFNEILEEYLCGTKTIDKPIALVMIDVDNFKKINDTFGHLTGDKVLKEIALILKKSVRSEDQVVRYGGDEFLLFLKDCTFATAEKVVSRAIQHLKTSDRFPIPIDISHGITVVNHKDDLLKAIQDADTQMYQMKTRKTIISPS
ncbi:MAG: GGDEF domain-containing protein [Firmicutes bacterium]|nr:GGDEF domain-containing protein [Bacillota bacterium]